MPAPFVENAVFFLLDGFSSLVKDQVTIGVWVHFWDLILQHKSLLFCSGFFFPVPISLRLFPTFSSINFSVSGFMWRSLIHLDLSFVQGDKNGSILILLHDNRQLCQHHLLKMLSFFPLDGFSSLVEDQVTIGVWDIAS